MPCRDSHLIHDLTRSANTMTKEIVPNDALARRPLDQVSKVSDAPEASVRAGSECLSIRTFGWHHTVLGQSPDPQADALRQHRNRKVDTNDALLTRHPLDRVPEFSDG